MAIDIGTGVINIEIDRRQLRQEAVRASRQLALTRTELNPRVNVQQLVRRLRQGLAVASSADVWRPVEVAGVRAMGTVAASGVASMQAIERRGLTAAAKLEAAFDRIRIPQQNFPQAGAIPQGATPVILGRGAQGGGTQNAINLATAATVLSQAGPLGEIAGQAAQGVASSGAIGGLIGASVAAAGVGVAAVARRFQRFGGFQGFNRATGANFFEAIGLRDTATELSREADAERIAGASLVGDASGDAALALEALARSARKASTASERARARDAAAAGAAPQPSQPRGRLPNVDEPRGRGLFGLASALVPGGGLLYQAAREIYNRRAERLDSEDAELEAAGKDIVNATKDERRAARQAADIRMGMLEFNEQRITSLARSVQEQKAETDLLTRSNEQSRRFREQFESQRIEVARRQFTEQRIENNLLERNNHFSRLFYAQRYEALRQSVNELDAERNLLAGRAEQGRQFQQLALRQGIAQREIALLQERQASQVRRQLLAGGGSIPLRLGERFSLLVEEFGTALRGWATGIAVAAVATYLFVRGVNAAARRFEDVAAAQIAAASIAQRTLAAPGGAAVDIGQVQAGIRAGAAGGLSELTVARTAIDAIRTGSEDIFLNTETVLRDLRVVAAATGVAFEDATTRFFRGIIKREQELLDELGIVARVEAANERYARSINVAASQLTPFQQQLAFANEVYRQLQVSANAFGRDAVLSTQEATESLNRLGAEWSNTISDIGSLTIVRGLSSAISGFTANFLRGIRIRLGTFFNTEAEVTPVSAANRLESERNRLIAERLGLISKQAIAGNLDIQQQRSLVEVQRQIAEQQARISAPGADFSEANLRQAASSQLEAQGILTNLREGRERGRISALQGPLNALLSSIEGGGRIARLSTEAYQDLTRGTAESEEAIRLLAVIYERTTEDVKELIEEYRQLDEEKKKAKKATDDERLSLNQLIAERQKAIRSGEFLREQYLALSRILPDNLRIADAARIAQGGPESVFRLPTGEGFSFEGAAERAGIVEAFEGRRRTGPIVELTQIDQFSLRAAEFGLTLDTMTSNLSSFVEGITLEGQNLQQALAAFLRNIARTLIQGASQNFGQQLLGGLFTNVTPGQPSSGQGLSLQDVNEASQRTGAYQRVDEFYEAVG